MNDVVEFEEALRRVLRMASTPEVQARWRTTSHEPVEASAGRILAAPITADRDQPPFNRSTRDGFAVHASAIGGPMRLIGSVRAGEHWTGAPLRPDEAVEIMTGAPVPAGANAVLMVEHAVLSEAGLTAAPGRQLRVGENIVPRGAEAATDSVLVPAGRRMGAPEVAVAAQCGRTTVEVYRQPQVAIISTGDELVDFNGSPEAWQIRNSNAAALAALVREAGGEPWRMPIARDTMVDLRARLDASRHADLLLISGGVSMGKYDLVEAALAERGARFFFTGARIQPGKPVVFGQLPPTAPQPQGQFFFGLPGNPISTEVCFRLFAGPLLRALGGEEGRGPLFTEARLADDVTGGAAVMRFLPAVVSGDWRGARVRLVPWHGSGDLAANARANGFAVLPIGPERFLAGETVRVLLR